MPGRKMKNGAIRSKFEQSPPVTWHYPPPGNKPDHVPVSVRVGPDTPFTPRWPEGAAGRAAARQRDQRKP
jgi:hypothetical protein